MAFSPDFEMMVTGSDDERVRVFNAVTGKLICKLKGHTGKTYLRLLIFILPELTSVVTEY